MKRSWIVAVALAALLCATLAGCAGSHFKVADVDPQTGLLKSVDGPVAKANVIESKSIDLRSYRSMVFVTEWSYSKRYFHKQIERLGFFEKVFDYSDLTKLVIQKGIADEVPRINNLISLSRIYRRTKPFLWIHPGDGKTGPSLTVVDPGSGDRVFYAEAPLEGFVPAYKDDQWFHYPLINALIVWLDQNSSTRP